MDEIERELLEKQIALRNSTGAYRLEFTENGVEKIRTEKLGCISSMYAEILKLVEKVIAEGGLNEG